MSTRYQVQILDGYVDGKESWRKMWVPRCYTHEDAEKAIEQLLITQPGKYRIRKVKQK